MSSHSNVFEKLVIATTMCLTMVVAIVMHRLLAFFPGVLNEIRFAWKRNYEVNWENVHSVCDPKMDEIIREAYIKNIGDIS